MKRILLSFLVLGLGGCSMTPVLMQPPAYEAMVATSSSKTASVSLTTGTVTGKSSSMVVPVVGSGVFIPVSTGPVDRLLFGRQDQEIFVEALRSECVRLGLFAAAASDNAEAADARIALVFTNTEHSPTFQSYALDVTMRIEGDGSPFEEQYRIVSDEGEGFWEKSNTNASEGKAKAGRKLMAALIPDIESWLRQQNPGEASGSGLGAPAPLQVHQQE